MQREQLRQLLSAALDAGLEALADGLAAALPAAAGPVRMIDPAELLVDPARFQFRVSTINLSGTDGRLRDACRWNPALAGVLLVWADGDGRLCLVDGHHRHRLAMANGVPLVAVLLVEATDAKAARVQGALSNVANGTAAAPDLAKLMRDCAMSAAEVAAHGVSPRARVLKDAAALVPLDGRLFARVCTGELELELGMALAAAGPPAVQRDLHREATRRRWDVPQVQEAAKLAQLATITSTGSDGCLPGLEALLEAENSNLSELLAIRAAIRRQLSTEVLALGVVASKRSALALEARDVAVVDREAAADARDSSRAQQRLFDQLAGHHGPLQECIRELAGLVSESLSAGDVVASNINRVRKAIEAELGA
jgi:hypothetical protein